ncbi:PIR Superfamily Protein [Plasmodium ovale wallikeri]|uniref:PIR Superfamily Protein n=1 Tax=Plasmodium ovale wallikeri TaxID=864142 RepID=A0A1A9AF08_PLAOA|nr:PIR Superfamily Protein [Plasmodium ovale wallikeri]SBT56287.1 PIR Superfamily Protein [Plasmodium ovale wallikeri]
MDGISSNYTLTMFAQEHVTLAQTDLYELYYTFNNVCNDIGGSPQLCSSDQSYKSLDSSVQELYKKLVSNLKRISNYEDNSFREEIEDKNKMCTYLKYWYYEQLITKNISDINISKIIEVWDKEKQSFPMCTCELYIKKLSDIKALKKIYDYFLFYELYKDINTIKNNVFDKPYCKYLEDVNRYLYTMLEMDCETKENSPYCKELKKYIKNYIKVDNSSEFSCTKDESLAELHPPTLGEDGLRGKAKEMPALNQGTTRTEHEAHIDVRIDAGEYDKSAISAAVSFSCVGIFVILFLLYKFTPIISYLQPWMRRSKRMIKNVNGEFNPLLSHESEMEQKYLDNYEYNIIYQSQ